TQGGDSFCENLRIAPLAANPIIEPKTNALNREIGIEPLRGVRKEHFSHPELREENFEPRGPVRTQREFYPSAGCPTPSSHNELRLDAAGSGSAARRIGRRVDLR